MNGPSLRNREMITFVGKPCRSCGSPERYVSSRACVACVRARAAAYYHENRAAIATKNYQDRHKPAQVLFNRARSHATDEHLPFTLRLEWLEQLVATQLHCPVFSHKFTGPESLHRRRALFLLNRHLGYTEDNTVLVSNKVNITTNREETERIAHWRKEQLTKRVSRET